MDATSFARCECECDNRSIDDPDFSQLKVILPSQYEYRLCCYKDLSSDHGFSATLRLPIGTREEAMKWKMEFQETSKTTLRLAKTYPHVSQKVTFKEDLRCQHNTRRVGKALEKTRPSSKDTKCNATMTIVIRRTGMKRYRSTNRHLPQFPMIVNMRYVHNHPINCADALRHRDVSDKVKKKFLDLFEAGHSPSLALKLHKYDMRIEGQGDSALTSADRAIIPDLQWCYRLYHSAAQKAYGGDINVLSNSESLTDGLNSEMKETVMTMDITSDTRAPILRDHTLDSGSEVQGVKGKLIAFTTSLMTKVQNDPATFLPAVKTFLSSSQKLKTDSALISALHTFGKYTGAAGAHSSKRISRLSGSKRRGVQPTAAAKKKAALGGCKCLSSGRLTQEPLAEEHGYHKPAFKRKATVDLKSGLLFEIRNFNKQTCLILNHS